MIGRQHVDEVLLCFRVPAFIYGPSNSILPQPPACDEPKFQYTTITQYSVHLLLYDQNTGYTGGLLNNCIQLPLSHTCCSHHDRLWQAGAFISHHGPYHCHHMAIGKCKKDITPVCYQWSYIFLALTQRCEM